MRTILDDYREMSLQMLLDEDVFLTCKLLPMKSTQRHNVVPDESHPGFILKFRSVDGYFVLPEAVQAGMSFDYADNYCLTHVPKSSAISFFGIDTVYSSVKNRHIVIRTAHMYVNVFTDFDPDVSLAK